ncbi:LemA family protein [Spiroplasma alleghenense]|uniref:LemA protein n=1 Tax=Spiroplasma alleghenense TaxID=216931 RepID=A0A345Z2R0_9MOLU|nr:LemA family protein [Spiroplasma alleghenense]AXK50889.1 LemA protein [Spiroplasma alleghenense]
MAYNPTPNNTIVIAKTSFLSKFVVYLSFILTLTITLWIYIGTKNNFIRQEQEINETASGIDVQLQRRADALQKLVETTRSAMNYEKSTLESVVALRNSGRIDPKDFGEFDAKTSKVLGQVNLTLERYPELKANDNVKKLQSAIVDCEDNIAAARRFYNTAIRNFNSSIQAWPAVVAASNLKLETRMYFEASEQSRQDVKMDLGF